MVGRMSPYSGLWEAFHYCGHFITKVIIENTKDSWWFAYELVSIEMKILRPKVFSYEDECAAVDTIGDAPLSNSCTEDSES